MPVVTALQWLTKHEPVSARVVALFGDDTFQKRQVHSQLRRELLSGEDSEFSLFTFDGRQASWADVIDELSTVSLFGGGPRLVVIEQADEFVSRFRQALEAYAAHPKSTGVLVLDVATWPANTRLAAAVAANHLSVDCKSPDQSHAQKWLGAWARDRYGVKLEAAAGEMLIDLIGPELGLLDQELAKLSAAAGPGAAITTTLVDQLVAGWRTQTAWEMLDAAAAGNAPLALALLDRLLISGENELVLLGQIGATLRRFGAATLLIEQAEETGQRQNVRQALADVGVRSFVLAKVEAQLRQLGRPRARQLYHWLLEADLALKGNSQMPPRFVLEQLLARMAGNRSSAREKTPR